jgi:flagellar hook assembly protein FlgD
MIRSAIDTTYCAGIEPRVVADFKVSVGPNPFKERATVSFSLTRPSPVSVSVYDVTGRLVRSLADRPFSEGTHVLSWDGKDVAGRPVGAGIYFYRFSSGRVAHTGKMSLLR